MKLRYTERAIADLDEIYDSIAQHNPLAAGERVKDLIRVALFFSRCTQVCLGKTATTHGL